MSVNVRFSDRDAEGLIPENTYLSEAAKRMGVPVPAACDERGTNDACAVLIEEGMALLSSLTDAEREHLSLERLAAGERLACQVRIERPGELRLRFATPPASEMTVDAPARDFGSDFRDLPLTQKVSTLVELEAMTAYEALKGVSNIPSWIGAKVLDVMATRGRTLDRRDRYGRRPAEHPVGNSGVPVSRAADEA